MIFSELTAEFGLTFDANWPSFWIIVAVDLQDRLLFGSAFPVLGVKQALEGYQKLSYKEGVLEKVLYTNAARLLGLSE